MTGIKTGKRISERSLILIRLKIFGGGIRFIFFVALHHMCLCFSNHHHCQPFVQFLI
jgi:hypothetical protein